MDNADKGSHRMDDEDGHDELCDELYGDDDRDDHPENDELVRVQHDEMGQFFSQLLGIRVYRPLYIRRYVSNRRARRGCKILARCPRLFLRIVFLCLRCAGRVLRIRICISGKPASEKFSYNGSFTSHICLLKFEEL